MKEAVVRCDFKQGLFSLLLTARDNVAECRSNLFVDVVGDNELIELFPVPITSHHFHSLDIRGTISATLKVFAEDPTKYPILEPLGLACRIFYNLRDYDEDIGAGLVNISVEDCQKFNISKNDLENKLSESVQDWFKDQSNQGIQLLTKHNATVSKGNFGLLARMTFPIVYEKSARKYFEGILSTEK